MNFDLITLVLSLELAFLLICIYLFKSHNKLITRQPELSKKIIKNLKF